MKNKKKLGLTLVLVLLVSFISSIMINANAGVNTKPIFEVEVSVNPNPASVGQDITVSGLIKPQPFELEIPRREVVLVLDVSGSMSGTRISKLKEASNNFINRMRSVPGLQIAIVAYSSEAVINPNGKSGNKNVASIDLSGTHQVPNYTSISNGFLPISDNRLNNMINSLEALGGTNTGEGLRKAQFIFNNGTAGVNKTIVFMSDGLPTFYSVQDTNTNFYTAIDNRNPRIAGTGAESTTNVNKSAQYATTIGAIIKPNVNNVFSIGYELGNANSTGNTIMKNIHNSMGGLDSNFFATSEGAIDSVMQQIATNIIDTYKINNIKLNLSFSSGITLANGGNIVDIDEVTYRKVSEVNGKARYEASNIPFSFTIKGSEEVVNHNIFENSNITYPWNNETLTVNLPQTFVTINKNSILPNISVTLEGATPNPSYGGEDITITYRVTPEDFTSKVLNTESGIIDEVIFITDLSQKMAEIPGNRFSVLQNGITNSVLNNSSLSNTKFGVIGYNEYISIGDRNNENAPKDVSMKNTTNVNELLVPLFDISDGNSKDGFRLLFQDGRMTLSSNNTRNIDGALTMAKNTFNKFGSQDKRKAIVLINAGNVNYTSSVAEDIKSQGYKIISLDISAASNTNLQSFHQALGGDTTDYLVGTIDGGNYNAVDSDMTKVAERLISGVINRPYPSVYPKLNFDLNGNFQYVNGSISSNISNVVLNGEKLFLELSPIKYTYTDRTTDNSYRYSAGEMVVSFRVRANTGRSGQLSFANNPNGSDNLMNFITYNRFNSNEVKNAIDTPIITIGSSDIQHGVYEGIKSSPPIYTGSPRDFAKGSNITMAALFKTIRNDTDIGLTVSPSLTVNDDIKIYKVLNDGNLEFIANMTVSDNNVYNYKLNVDPGTTILVLYNVTVPTNVGTYTNTIYVGPETKDAVIKVQDVSLPDLF